MPTKDFINLVRSLSPALFRLPLLGHVAPFDLDGQPLDAYVRPTTISAGATGPVWRKDAKGWWFGQNQSLAAGGGAIVVPDSGAASELNLQSGTLFFTARSFRALLAEGNHYIFAKRDGGGNSFYLYVYGVGTDNRLALYNGVTASTTLAIPSLAGAHFVAVRITAGSVPKFFVDGVYRADGSVAFTPVVNDADVYMANSFSFANGSRNDDYGAFALFNDAILGRSVTDQEIAQLYEAWESTISVFSPKRTYFLPKKATDIVAPTPLAHLSGGISPGNLWLDSTGNGRDGTVSGRVTQSRSPERTCLSAYGAGDPLIQSAISFGYDAANWTLEFDFMARSTGGGGQGALFALTDGGVVRALLCFSAANTFSYSITHDTTTGVWTFSSGPYNVWHTLVIRHARSGLGSPTVELDGESIAVANPTPPVGALTALAAPRVNLLNVAAVSSDFDGCIDDFKFYDSLLSDAQSRALYVDKALSGARRLANRTDYPVSPAAVAAGGMVGPWRVISGTHKWDDDGQRRRLLGVTSGDLAALANQAYGAWYGRISKTALGNALVFPLLASVPVAHIDLRQNSYNVSFDGAGRVQLLRYLLGVLSVRQATALNFYAAGVTYELFVNRRPRDGTISGWLRGGEYPTWTALWTSAEPSTITSNFVVGSLGAGSVIADYSRYPGGASLLPTELPT